MPTGWLTAGQLQEWRLRYDSAPTRPVSFTVDGDAWPRCYSSDLERAYVTAQAVYPGEIARTPLLREAEFALFPTGGLLLPFWMWRWALQLTWLTGHGSQRALRDEFSRRVRAVADLAEETGADTLLVSHAGMMAYLRKELLRRGFTGPKFRMAEHARLYVFEKGPSSFVATSQQTESRHPGDP